jgi:hypothetical protein
MMKIGDGSKPAAGVSDDDNKLVVQQVKEVGVTLRYPMLSENNYSVWAMKMKIFMLAQGVRGGKISQPALCMTVYSKVNGVSTLWFPGDDEVITKEVGAVMII